MLSHEVISTIAKLSIIVCLGLQIIPNPESAPLTGSLRFTPAQSELDKKQWSSTWDINSTLDQYRKTAATPYSLS
jgi:hypothetical protein